MSAENSNNNNVLYLNSDTSIVLPYFDTSSVANSNIDAIILSLYVLDKTPEVSSRVQITINPVDLNTNNVDDGLSAFVNVSKDSYIDFKLPKELFEQTVHKPKRFLVHLVNKDQKIVLAGPDMVGTTQDPKLIVVHTKLNENEIPDQPKIIENNYYTIENAQLHFGVGDNVGNNKIGTINTSALNDIPLWLKWLVAIATIFGAGWGVYSYLHTKDSNIQQYHSGQGDNIIGDKIINIQKYSSTQFIKSWPEYLGGVDELNLDNIGILKAYFPRDEYSITLISNIIPIGMPDRNESEKFKSTGNIEINETNQSDKILFDLKNPVHAFEFQNRIFNVKLLSITEKQIKDVQKAIEYKFGISEK